MRSSKRCSTVVIAFTVFQETLSFMSDHDHHDHNQRLLYFLIEVCVDCSPSTEENASCRAPYS